LGYRLYADLRRGWRLTNPNLEQLKLLQLDYQALDECCQDEDEWRKGHALLGSLSPEKRLRLAHEILDLMRKGLCIKCRYLDPLEQEQIRNRSFTDLKEPWGLTEEERELIKGRYLIPRSRPRQWQVNVDTLHLSYRSKFGRKLKNQSFWGLDNPHYPTDFDESVYNAIVDNLFKDFIDLRLCPGRRSRKWANGVSDRRFGPGVASSGAPRGTHGFREPFSSKICMKTSPAFWVREIGSSINWKPGNTQLKWMPRKESSEKGASEEGWPPSVS
jgi:hypothetical protein